MPEGDIYAVSTDYRMACAGVYTTPRMSRERAYHEFDAMLARIPSGGIRSVHLLRDGAVIKQAEG